MRIHQGKQYLVIWSKINLGKDRNDFWFVRTGERFTCIFVWNHIFV